MYISKVKNDDGSYDIYLEKIGSWYDYENIARMLINELKCCVVEEKDMVTDKDIIFKIDEVVFIFTHHYMLGNFFHTNNSEDLSVIEQLANNVINIINEKLKQKGIEP